jgi:hypothetical protein
MIEKEEPTEEAKQRAKNYMSLKGALEPKQETLEEASWIFNPLKKLDGEFLRDAFVKGAKWQAERMYSEEDLKEAFEAGHKKGFSGYPNTENWKELPFEKWFEQFKKK